MFIAGVDEVGRGPLAGPVVTAAVIIQERIEGVTDSKKLSAVKRKILALLIKEKAIAFAYGRAEVHEIDSLNIHHATLLAMKRAIEALTVKPTKVMVDGLFRPAINLDCEAVVGGDLSIYEIGAASILAKVARDAEMEALHLIYPQYGFDQHKGYATPLHKQALQQWGPCSHHRKSFAPVVSSM